MSIERLYKYGSFGRYSESLFSTGKVWFSPPTQLNDPFECRPWFTFTGGRDEIIESLRRDLKRQYPSATDESINVQAESIVAEGRHRDPATWENLRQDVLRMLANKIGLFCLSARPDSILMWSHYGVHHTGFCIEFIATDDTPFFGTAQPVQYSEKFPVVDFYKTPNDEQVDLIFLTKYIGWAYEQEWRVIDHENGPGLREYPVELLKSVTFGIRTPEHDKEQVRSWVGRRGHPVALYQATQGHNRFAIEISETE